MRFSVVTPSFRNSNWLKLCIASIADQQVDLEHIIQDAGSDDGTLDWLLQDDRVKAFVEKDKGMYDAVNRGLKKSSGEILSYLNCDEQYLPGALSKVEEFFRQNPGVEMVFGDAIIINPRGEFLCHRKSLLPLKPHSMVSDNLAMLTCASFFRHSLIEKRGLFFDSTLRDLGDAEWIVRCIEQKVPMGLLKDFTSVFTDTGENMNLKPNAQREKKAHFAAAPWWSQKSRSLIVLHHRCRKLLAGGYQQEPFQYEIYTSESPAKRVCFDVSRPVARFTRYAKQTN
ncbi:MAG: glycosyltransferase family 2 protein [Verrucomicrobiota bacterium]